MPTIIRSTNIDVADTQEIELLSELIDGNLTIYEYQTRSNSNIAVTGARIGLDANQIATLESSIVERDRQFMIDQIKAADGNQTEIQRVATRYGLT